MITLFSYKQYSACYILCFSKINRIPAMSTSPSFAFMEKFCTYIVSHSQVLTFQPVLFWNLDTSFVNSKFQLLANSYHFKKMLRNSKKLFCSVLVCVGLLGELKRPVNFNLTSSQIYGKKIFKLVSSVKQIFKNN